MNPFRSEEFWQCFLSSKTVPYARYRCSLTPSLSLLVSDYLLLSLPMEGEGHRPTRAGRVDGVALLSCLLFAPSVYSTVCLSHFCLYRFTSQLYD